MNPPFLIVSFSPAGVFADLLGSRCQNIDGLHSNYHFYVKKLAAPILANLGLLMLILVVPFELSSIANVQPCVAQSSLLAK